MALYRHLGLPFRNIERPTEHERAAIRLLNYAQSKNDAKLWVSIATSYSMFGILGSRGGNHPSTWTSAGLNTICAQSVLSEEFRNDVQPLVFQMNNRLETLGGIYANGKTFDFLDYTPRLFALMEELGIFYVYVQLGGESFQKREIKIRASDGEKVEVLSGIKEGERIVTKGAYQIKLSAASGKLPAHGHEH